MRLYLIILLSVAVLRCYTQEAGSLIPEDERYPIPIIKLLYLNENFTRDLIIKSSFKGGQLIPVGIELITPEMNNTKSSDFYITIESVRVTFVRKENGAVLTTPFQGNLVLIPVNWPHGYVFESGSRIAFTVKYNYHLKKEIVETGEVIEQIRF